MEEVTHRCPKCGGYLERIHRRPFDRFLSMLIQVRRYQCQNFRCQWEGLLRLRNAK